MSIALLLLVSIYHVPANLGYGILFGLILIESAGAPVPGETSLIAAGVLASQGHLSLPVVFAVAISAAIIGDNFGYLVGRRAGNWLLTRPGRWEEQRLRILDEGEHFFSRHGGKTVFFGRWLPVLRFTAALLAGVNEMPWRRFFVFNAMGGSGWVLTVGSAAYLLGKQRIEPVRGDRPGRPARTDSRGRRPYRLAPLAARARAAGAAQPSGRQRVGRVAQARGGSARSRR